MHSVVGNTIKGWLLASPLVIILGCFLVLPIIAIVIVSFWGATEYSYYPAFLPEGAQSDH